MSAVGWKPTANSLPLPRAGEGWGEGGKIITPHPFQAAQSCSAGKSRAAVLAARSSLCDEPSPRKGERKGTRVTYADTSSYLLRLKARDFHHLRQRRSNFGLTHLPGSVPGALPARTCELRVLLRTQAQGRHPGGPFATLRLTPVRAFARVEQPPAVQQRHRAHP